jgi:curved DNA-binding protein CbpA
MDGLTLQSGEIGDIPLLDLFISARNAPFPTALLLQRGDQRRTFFFVEGSVVAVEAEALGESFPTMLSRRKKISRDDAERVARAAQDDGISSVSVLLRDGSLGTAELARELSLWAVALLIQSFSWEAGTYELKTVTTTRDDALVSVNLPAALARGVLKHTSLEMARSLLSPYLDLAPDLEDTGVFVLDELELDPSQRSFVDFLDGTRSTASLLDVPLEPPGMAARILFFLHRGEMLSMAPPRAALPQDAPVAAAPAMARTPARPVPVSAPPEPPERIEPAPVAPTPAAVDFSSIRFQRGARHEGVEGTFHAVTPGTRETVTRHSGPVQVQAVLSRGVSPDAAGAEVESAARVNRIAALFGEGAPVTAPRAAVSPPRGPGAPRGTPQPRVQSPAGGPVATPSTAASPLANPVPDDGPPAGAGPAVEQEEWELLPTKEKERVRVLRNELNRLERTNYFEWFDATPESQSATIKKAYFNAARRYHPDSLVNENPIFARLAEALFARLSEAYEVLSDDELRDKYHRKHVLGEKDENDLAMEKVQAIMAAEGSFKKGMQLLNAGKLGEALPHFKKAVEGYPEEGEYQAYYGYALFRLKEKTDSKAAQEGLQILAAGAEVRPGNPKPWHLLGKVMIQVGDFDGAKTNLKRSLKIQPDNPDALRDYKRADALSRGEAPPGPGGGGRAEAAAAAEPSKGILGGFLGRFGGKDGKK